MKFRLILFFAVLAFLVSCKKTEDKKVVLPPDNFQPVSAMSTWTYSEFPGSAVYTITSTGLDSTFNAEKYKEMFSNVSGLFWFRKENGNYYQLFEAGTEKQEYLYLKDKGAVGDHWEFSHVVNGLNATFKYKILEMNTPRLVNGIIYEQVITVKRDTYLDFGTGVDSLYTSEDYSFANDVGLILISKGNDKTYLSHYKIW
ncbi:MAG: hypothetical protein NTU44_15560 [Bacteroidetes bacterium]|nr:hypothetical protein [Bacteroidota bacterium]